MVTMPLKRMKLRTKNLASELGASYGHVRDWNSSSHRYTRFHQGWDLEAATGTPCYAISEGIVTHVGYHPDFGYNVVMQFSRGEQRRVSSVDSLWAFYAHLSSITVKEGQLVQAGNTIGLTGHSGNASASAPHLHFEIHNVPDPSPGRGKAGRVDPAAILGYHHLVCG